MSAAAVSAAVGAASGGAGLLAVVGVEGSVAGLDPDVLGSVGIGAGVVAVAAASLLWTARTSGAVPRPEAARPRLRPFRPSRLFRRR